MKKQLPNFSVAKILVLGDIMLDRYWFGDAARISPEAPVPVVKIKHLDERPGGAGNVALNIASLNATVTLIGLTGDDLESAALKKQLSNSNVNYDIYQIGNMPTITKLRVISRHQQLIRLDFEEKFPSFDTAILLNIFKKHLKEANLVILSDYGKGTIYFPQDFIQLAKQAGVPVLVDPKGIDFSIYNGADIITPNFKEFENVVGACASEKDIIQKGNNFLEKNNIGSLLLTRGELGMTLIQRHAEAIHLPAHAREVFDVTGAGDTVIALLGAALAANSDLANAMSLANLAASLVVAKLGAATITTAELQVAINESIGNYAGVLTEEQLKLAVCEARLQGKKIVFTNGCFDILHAGHITYLQQAKMLGDYLIVALNDDDSIKKLKGPARPINSLMHRMTVVAGLASVSWVIPFSDVTPERILKWLQPDILVKGGDYSIDEVVGADIVKAYGGEVRVLGNVENLSTTNIIDRAVKNIKRVEHA